MGFDKTEKRWLSIPAQAFTADGTDEGQITVADACLFKVKQEIKIKSSVEPCKTFEVKRVISKIELLVGLKGNINRRADVSAYLVADSAEISAAEQNRPSIPQLEYERATYEEEPTVAKRVCLVDVCGNKYNKDNPFPVVIDNVSIDADINVQLTHKDNDPEQGDVNDSVRVGDGTETVNITTKNDMQTADILNCEGEHTVITVSTTPIEVKVGANPLAARKAITVFALSGKVFWGYSSSVDTTDGTDGGTPLFKNQFLQIGLGKNVSVFLVTSGPDKKVAITEAA